jgi:hypothetical protein
MCGVTSKIIVDTISKSYDKADQFKFRAQTATFLFGKGTKVGESSKIYKYSSFLMKSWKLFAFFRARGEENKTKVRLES